MAVMSQQQAPPFRLKLVGAVWLLVVSRPRERRTVGDPWDASTVKQAELHIGNEYALPTYKPYDAAPLAARIRVVSIDGGGKVTVRVVDPGVVPPKDAWGARPVKRNERRQVTTRDIACPWEQWADRAASIGAELRVRVAEHQARHDDFERRHADRLVIDAERALPTEYDEEFFDAEQDAEERATLSGSYIKARELGPYATLDELRPLLVDLPVPVLRDILATDAHGRPGAPALWLRPSCVRLSFSRLLALRRSIGLDMQAVTSRSQNDCLARLTSRSSEHSVSASRPLVVSFCFPQYRPCPPGSIRRNGPWLPRSAGSAWQ
jgi:hypothetical protein